MMNKQSMRSSQTMPQLFYTRQDIQEQYLSTTKVRQQQQELATPNTSSSNLNNKSSKRARSSDPKHNKEFEEYESDQDEEEDSSFSNDAPGDKSARENNAGRAGRSRARAKAARKRRKRARSASLFSACFTIPNLGSILTSQTLSGSSSNNSSSSHPKRSILSHLGIGQKFSSPMTNTTTPKSIKQRPISTSQTAGNLHQVSQQQDMASSSQQQVISSPANNGGRKHVSFGGGGGSGSQQKQKQMVPSADNQQNTEHGFEQGTFQQLDGSNSVIMRGHQAHDQPQVAAQAKTQEISAMASPTTPKTTHADIAFETQPQTGKSFNTISSFAPFSTQEDTRKLVAS